MARFPETINGYIPLPVVVGQSAKPKPKPIYHVIYIKKHSANTDESMDIKDRSVFCVNLPTDTTIRTLKKLSQDLAGSLIEDFQPAGFGNNGIIVFVDKQACKNFLSRAKKANKNADNYEENTEDIALLKWESTATDLSGSQRYKHINRNKYSDVEQLQDEVNRYMEDFSQMEESRAREVQTFAEEVDEDGFIKVVNTKRKSLAGYGANAIKMTENELQQELKKKKKSKEKKDFYRFQLRDQKKQEMNALLKRFQDDKQKIEELKQKKRFKLY